MIPIRDNIPTDRFPLVTVALIALSSVLYLLSTAHGGSLISGPDSAEVLRYGVVPDTLAHGRGLGRALTSLFVHASLVHLAGDMLFLWIFGPAVEDSMGRMRFLGFYLLGGIVAIALPAVADPSSDALTVGASGAVAAVLGGYLVLYARARVITLSLLVFFTTVFELPVVIMAALWFAEQALFGALHLTDPNGQGAVAALWSVGGFIFGLAAIRPLAAKRKQVPARLPAFWAPGPR